MVDPDLELRGVGGCFACPAAFSFFFDLIFFTQNKGGQASPLDPLLLFLFSAPSTGINSLFPFLPLVHTYPMKMLAKNRNIWSLKMLSKVDAQKYLHVVTKEDPQAWTVSGQAVYSD